MLIDRLPRDDDSSKKLVVFITNDLTEKTLKEAISVNASLIVSYHPRPFGKQKKFGRDDPTSRIILECAGRGIGVYSPHTALDKVSSGMNDWLCSGLGKGTVQAVHPEGKHAGSGDGPVGAGRKVQLQEEVSLGEMVQRVRAHLLYSLYTVLTTYCTP
jgi:putative NIF3 family GTP cyclohydrolase 1 type 2